MSERHYEIVLCRSNREHITVEALAARAGLHPGLVERYVESGLLDPIEWVGSQALFDSVSVPRLQTIERLRGEIGINLAGIAVILDLLDRLHAL
ncbi:MAG: chaperone modulator CbpM, partial [Acidobacteria bacterium]|nr:chaperone modulator CbpM [Acidobacteriota bacterium]